MWSFPSNSHSSTRTGCLTLHHSRGGLFLCSCLVSDSHSPAPPPRTVVATDGGGPEEGVPREKSPPRGPTTRSVGSREGPGPHTPCDVIVPAGSPRRRSRARDGNLDVHGVFGTRVETPLSSFRWAPRTSPNRVPTPHVRPPFLTPHRSLILHTSHTYCPVVDCPCASASRRPPDLGLRPRCTDAIFPPVRRGWVDRLRRLRPVVSKRLSFRSVTPSLSSPPQSEPVRWRGLGT